MENRLYGMAQNIRKLAMLYRECDCNRNIRRHLENTAVALERLLIKPDEEFNEKKMRKKLGSVGIKCEDISYVHMHDGRARVGLYAYTKAGCVKTQKMADIIGDELETVFVPGNDERSIVSTKKAYYVIYEQTNYKVMSGYAVLSKNKEEISGDSYTVETADDGRAIMAIADGMGTGEAAACKSRLVIELVESLFENGYDSMAIPDMINSAIIESKSDEPVTMDIVELNLDNGMGHVIKMGGAASFILRNGKVIILRPSSLPAGVIEEVEEDVWEQQFEDGDYIIMVSDGVVDCLPFYDKESKLAEILEKMKCRNPQKMAEHIMSECRYFCGDDNMDDMTVLVMGVWKTKDLQTLK